MDNVLLDTFCKKGSDLDEFYALIASMDARTRFVRLKSGDLQLLSIVSDSDTHIYCHRLMPDTEQSFDSIKTLRKLDKAKLRAKGVSDELMREIVSTGLLFYNGQSIMLTSPNIMSGLWAFGVKGSFLDTPCLARDMVIARQFSTDKECTLVTREAASTKKAFAILGGRFNGLPQSIILDIIDVIEDTGEMGQRICREWQINNFTSSVHVEFPQKGEELRTIYGIADELIPGILISSSDTGDSSVRVRGTWRWGDSVSLHGEVKRKHIGKVTAEDMLEHIQAEIFGKYPVFLEKLCELTCKPITEATLTRTQNKKAVEEALKQAFKEVGIIKAVGIKNEIALYDKMSRCIDGAMNYTAYDIALMVLQLPEKAKNLTDSAAELLQVAIGRVPNIL